MFRVTLLLIALLSPSANAESIKSHGIAMHGAPKYSSNFQYFDYVNPVAPKGGRLKLGAVGTFDSFNPYIPKGNAGAGATMETLMTTSADEPFSAYGLIAESIEVPEDRSWAQFKIREEAKWHDGKPITVDDVIWSLNTLKEYGHPFYRFYYGDVSSAIKVSKDIVKFEFSDKTNRELPLIVGQMPILPKHYWEGKDFTLTTLEPPLSSGPYRIENFEPGRFITLERVKDYWGLNLPVNKGTNNFNNIRIDYYRDETVIREALKSGDIDYREENQAKAWALDYDTPAVSQGRLKKVNLRHYNPTGMQAFVYNTRRPIFQDVRVRQALAYAFDFEWTNKNLFFGQYTRTKSFFSNSDLAATGLPTGLELKVLEKYKNKISKNIFTTPYEPPATDGLGWPRDNLTSAQKLLQEAGWDVENMILTNSDSGDLFTFEILLYSEGFERIVLPFARNLKKLGVDVRVRRVDQTQYINRVRNFDYDMIVSGWGSSESPGNEQFGHWSSSAADSPAASNYAGVRDSIIDELIGGLVQAKSREDLVAHTRALDRLLLSGYYVIPQWHLTSQRILYWDKFGLPKVTPKSGTSTNLWWFDSDKFEQLTLTTSTQRKESNSNWLTYGLLALVLLIGALAFNRIKRKKS
ncbi:extracellular solute-binding protein [Burkholderiales bacterium]|nr:extracellular solute-binding protein [Burkholderiales bacterium]